MRIKTQCPECQDTNIVTVQDKDYDAWQEGVHAQDAFPYLSDAQRELLISGIDNNCWNKIFEFDENGD